MTAIAARFISNIHIINLKQNEQYIPPQNVAYLGYLGQIALEQKFDIAVGEIANSINDIINEIFKHDINGQPIIEASLMSLRTIGKTALNQDLDIPIINIIQVILDIGKKSVEKYEISAKTAIYVLEDICVIILNKRLEIYVLTVTNSLVNIGNEAILKNKENIIDGVLNSLYRIGNIALEYKIETSALATLQSLEIVGTNLIRFNIVNLALKAIDILQKFEKIAKENQMENTLLWIEIFYTNFLETAKNNNIEEIKETVEKILKTDNE